MIEKRPHGDDLKVPQPRIPCEIKQIDVPGDYVGRFSAKGRSEHHSVFRITNTQRHRSLGANVERIRLETTQERCPLFRSEAVLQHKPGASQYALILDAQIGRQNQRKLPASPE
jgi:hypothetical protein